MKTIQIPPETQIVVDNSCYSRLLTARLQGKALTFCNEGDNYMFTCRNCFGLGTLTFRASSRGKEEYIQTACPVCDPELESDRVICLLSQSGLQPEEYGWSIEYLAEATGKARAVATARQLIAAAPQPQGWVSLYGPYGVGKSGLMKATVAALCRLGVPALYRRADDILSEAKAVFSEDPAAQDASEQAIKARYGRYPFLAIDEVDRIGDSAWSRAFLFTILDERYNVRQKQATMIATNMLPGQLTTHFGYLADRMKDGQRIILAGASLRGKSREGGEAGELEDQETAAACA
jgi:hypothetical protein